MNVIKALISKFSRQETLKRVTANFSWLLSERMILMAVTLFVGIYMARYLGPEDYGVLNFALSFVGLFTTMADLGLAKVTVKELVDREESRDELIGTAFILQLLGALFMFALVFGASFLIDTTTESRWIIYIIAFGLIFSSFQPIAYYFQSKVLSKYEAISRTSGLVTISSAKIVLALSGAPLLYFAFAYMLRFVPMAITLVHFYQKKVSSIFQWKVTWKTARGLLQDCWPIVISGIVVSFNRKIDQVMINQMLGSTEVGYYAAAAKLSEVWYFIPTIIISSVYPILIKYKKQSEALYKRQLRKMYDLMVVLSISLAIPVSFMSDWIAHIIYGPAYVQTGAVLAIHVWGGVFVFMNVVRSNWIVMEKQQKYAPIMQAGSAVVNVGFNLILIPIYGVLGAAVATLATAASSLLLTPLFINAKYRGQVVMALGSLNIFMLIHRLFLYSKKIKFSQEAKSK